MDEILNRVLSNESTKHLWRDRYDSTEWKEANELNKILFELPLNTSKKCECLEDLYMMLKRPNIGEKLIRMQNKLFKLKKGRLITRHGCDHISEHSSEETYLKLLKENPKYIRDFEKFPEDWEEIVENYDPEAEAEETGSSTEGNSEDQKETKELVRFFEVDGKSIEVTLLVPVETPDDAFAEDVKLSDIDPKIIVKRVERDLPGNVSTNNVSGYDDEADERDRFLIGMGFVFDEKSDSYTKEGANPVPGNILDIDDDESYVLPDEAFYKPFTVSSIKDVLKAKKIEVPKNAVKDELIKLVRVD